MTLAASITIVICL